MVPDAAATFTWSTTWRYTALPARKLSWKIMSLSYDSMTDARADARGFLGFRRFRGVPEVLRFRVLPAVARTLTERARRTREQPGTSGTSRNLRNPFRVTMLRPPDEFRMRQEFARGVFGMSVLFSSIAAPVLAQPAKFEDVVRNLRNPD